MHTAAPLVQRHGEICHDHPATAEKPKFSEDETAAVLTALVKGRLEILAIGENSITLDRTPNKYQAVEKIAIGAEGAKALHAAAAS